MKKRIFRIAASVLTAVLMIPAAGCGQSKDEPPETVDASEMTLAFADEFDGDALDEEVWSYDIGNGANGWGNNELQYYTDKPENVEVSGGTLKITARAEKKNSFDFTSARIKTQGKADFGYGYVEARMRLPAAKGAWPAFWMMGEEEGWPLCGEIDIMETKNADDIFQSTVHWADPDSPFINSKINLWQAHVMEGCPFLSIEDKTAWHTFGVWRTEKQIAFYVDGRRHYVLDLSGKKMPEQMQQDFYVLLNVACGGNYVGQRPDSDLNVQMEVDYVRWYR